MTPRPATANTTKESSRASRESGWLGAHSHGEDRRGKGRHIANSYRYTYARRETGQVGASDSEPSEGESTLSSEMDNAVLEIGDDDFDY